MGVPLIKVLNHQDVDFECSPIRQFYQGKTVFITGATGFMGKVGRQFFLLEQKEEEEETQLLRYLYMK